MTRRETLEAATQAVMVDRNATHGDPDDNFQHIAEFWTTFKGVPFTRHDVAVMCALIKVARMKQSPENPDHAVDLAGYAACANDVATKG